MKACLFILSLFCLSLPATAEVSQLEHIKQHGTLTVLGRYTPTSYHHKGQSESGFEYELAHRFANKLGVDLTVLVPNNLQHLIHLLQQGHADIATAGLTITPQRQQQLRFGPSYQQITQQLVYRQGNDRPKDLSELGDKLIEVVADSSHSEQLRRHQQSHPDLNWIENNQLDSGALLELVQLEMIDYTIADSNEVTALQNLYPELRVAFDISEPQELAWAILPSDDDSLYEAIDDFFEELKTNGELDRLLAKYYGHLSRFDYVDTRAFYRKFITELPKYRPLFQRAAKQFNLDWQLLAAISYQESHWNPEAVSHTGVKGLMMITSATAKQMNIADREDPKQSVFAGAGYLNLLKERLAERITEPDRTWLALAAYNVGLGHLEDARILTQQNGFNPDYWPDVKQHLPLLSKKKWYSQTRNGYARGSEPVRYIENIRRYYDILLYDTHSNPTHHIETTPFNRIPSAL